MKKLKSAVWGVALVLCAMLANSSVAFAAESGAENVGKTLSLTYCIPFVGMLLCIAICPLIVGEWWEKWKPAVVIFWSLVFIVPFATFIGAGTAWEQVLESIIGDYLGFIVLLFGLFCVAGNIVLEGDLVGTPKLNVLLLLIGTVLAGWIGTTGASMVMIRPLIRANKWRQRKAQIVIFFIFLVSNIGGCLTPVGDPPLLMGFNNGVDMLKWILHVLLIKL